MFSFSLSATVRSSPDTRGRLAQKMQPCGLDLGSRGFVRWRSRPVNLTSALLAKGVRTRNTSKTGSRGSTFEGKDMVETAGARGIAAKHVKNDCTEDANG